MKVLLLGSGGREHAIAYCISKSPKCEKLFIVPGNPGTAQCGENVTLSLLDFNAIGNFCLKENIEMVVVGPEDPLVKGVYDYFQSDEKLKHIAVIGPSKAGAQLEGSKVFAKIFMQKYKIPTAAYHSFNESQIDEAIDFIITQQPPIVLKADGLAAGKGVIIAQSTDEAEEMLKEILVHDKFGEAGNKVVVEQFLKGIEVSVFALTDGKNYLLLPTAKDYKRVGEGDTGLNTGGMGAVSPVPFADAVFMKKVEEKIIRPTISGLQQEKITYKGFIYFGLIKVDKEPFVIEYNCRLGDPETEVVLPRIKTDLLDLFSAVADETLSEKKIEVTDEAAVTIVLTSGGYPDKFEKGKEITGIDKILKSIVFHAGTTEKNGKLLTNGGRVLSVTSFGKNIKEAMALSQKSASTISFEKKYFRQDIGFEFLE